MAKYCSMTMAGRTVVYCPACLSSDLKALEGKKMQCNKCLQEFETVSLATPLTKE